MWPIERARRRAACGLGQPAALDPERRGAGYSSSAALECAPDAPGSLVAAAQAFNCRCAGPASRSRSALPRPRARDLPTSQPSCGDSPAGAERAHIPGFRNGVSRVRLDVQVTRFADRDEAPLR